MNKKRNSDSIISMLVQSIIIIAICCVCFVGSTFAWFTSEDTIEIESISASKLQFDIAVLDEESGFVVNVERESLMAGRSYLINISLNNSSTSKKGYCKIEIENINGTTAYYTPMFEKGAMESMTIELITGAECRINIISSWGSHSNDTCGNTINNCGYSITYDLDGGSATAPNPTIYTVGNTLTLNNPTKEGFDFLGWTGSNGEEPQIIVTIEPNSIGDKTYTAVWQEIVSYNISYELNEGSFSEAAPTSYDKNSGTFTLPEPTKEGFDFVGWTGSNGEVPERIVTLSGDDVGDKSYIAHWEAKQAQPEQEAVDDPNNTPVEPQEDDQIEPSKENDPEQETNGNS